MQVKAFDGRVIFDCSGPNMKVVVVAEGFLRAVPEHRLFMQGTDTATYFTDLIEFIGRTRSIQLVEGVEPDEILLQLLTFWETHGASTDYKATWQAFLDCNSMVHNEWVLALNTSDRAQLKAPDIVQPNAPTDDELEKLGDEGKKKSKSAIPTSKRLTNTPQTSPSP